VQDLLGHRDVRTTMIYTHMKYAQIRDLLAKVALQSVGDRLAGIAVLCSYLDPDTQWLN